MKSELDAKEFKTKTLKVEGLPEKVTANRLKFFFQNKYGNGGGPVENVIHFETSRSAIITFKSTDSVDVILGRQRPLEIMGTTVKVSAFEDENSDESSNKDEEIKGNEVPVAMSHDRPSSGSELEDRLHCTVRAHIINVTRCKQAYTLYFEDKKFGLFPFDEKTMVLDGLNRCLYVTFSKQEDASAICKFDHAHEEDSNISSIEVASAEDLLFYSDMMSIHGLDFTAPGMKEKLCKFVHQKTKEYPVNIELGEEARSAIIKFASQDFNNISNATWTCAKWLENVFLITAPVPRSKSIIASAGSKQIEAGILRRYFSSKIHSGGGPCKTQPYKYGTKVTFVDITDQEGVLKKDDHRIGEVDLTVIPFHYCLSKAAYKDRVETNIDQRRSVILKAKIYDVTKQKDYYTLYFQSELNAQSFVEKDMILDALNRSLYVTFWNPTDAEIVLNTETLRENNIISIEKVSVKDLQFYNNVFSIHGIDFTKPGMKDKLSNFIEQKTRLGHDIILGEEPKSAIVHFQDIESKVTGNIYQLAWKCAAEMDQVRLITAPVSYSTTLIVSDCTKIETKVIKWYMSSPKNGGGLVLECKRFQNDKFLITFQDHNVCDNIVNRGQFTLFGKILEPREYHMCLSQRTYQDFLENFPPELQNP